MSRTRPARGWAPVSRRAAAAVAFLAAAALATSASTAADWRFDPEVGLSVVSTDNVQVTSTIDESDLVLRANVDLRVSAAKPRSLFTIAYQPRSEFHDDFSELNHTSHFLRLGWSTEASERSSWNARLSASQSETPRLVLDDVAEEFVAAPRDDTFRMTGGLGGEFRVSRLSNVFFKTEYTTTIYDDSVLTGEDLNGDGTGDLTPLDVNDANTTTFELGWGRQLGRDDSFRISYRGSRIDEGARDETDVNRLMLGWSRGDAQTLLLSVSAGAGRRTTKDPAGVNADSESTSFVTSARLQGRAGRRGAFQLGLSRDFSDSRGISGTTETDSFFGSFSTATGRWSSVSVFTRWSNREPVRIDPTLADTETLSFGAGWTAAIGPKWGFRFEARRIDQESGTVGDPRIAESTTLSAGVRWTPTETRQ